MNRRIDFWDQTAWDDFWLAYPYGEYSSRQTPLRAPVGINRWMILQTRKQFEERRAWCRDNLGRGGVALRRNHWTLRDDRRWAYVSSHASYSVEYVIAFAEAKDLLLFKLWWSDEDQTLA